MSLRLTRLTFVAIVVCALLGVQAYAEPVTAVQAEAAGKGERSVSTLPLAVRLGPDGAAVLLALDRT